VARIAVLGGGHGALACAGDLALQGHDVHLALRNRDRFAELFTTCHLAVAGAVEGKAALSTVTADHAAAVTDAELVLVPVPAFAQRSIAEAVAGRLERGQVVCLMPGTLTTLDWAHALSAHGREGVVLAETAILPYGARATGPAGVEIAFLAAALPTGFLPSGAARAALEVVRKAYPVATAVEDVLSAALLNTGGAVHAPLVFMNAGSVGRPTFDIHRHGTAEAVLRVIAALDDERIALRRRLGYSEPHWPVIDFYRDRHWLWGARSRTRLEQNSVWAEQVALDHRYVREDVACGLALWAALGERMSVATPLTDAFLTLAGAATGVNWRRGGQTLDSLLRGPGLGALADAFGQAPTPRP